MLPKCDNEHCEAHVFTMDLISKLEGVTEKLMDGQHDIKENIIRLTENLLELQRTNQRYDKMCEEVKAKDKEQDDQIKHNSAFVNKAIGVVGAISLIAVMASGITAVLTFFLR